MKRFLCLSLCLICILFLPLRAFGVAGILNIRHWTAPDHTRIVIDTSEEVEFFGEKSDNKVLLTLDSTVISSGVPRELVLNEPGISRVVLTSLPAAKATLEFFLTGNAEANIFKLKKFEGKPDRVVVDIRFPEVEKRQSRERERVKIVKKDKIIVVDPGHGGEDPGAVGRQGPMEKDVVLKIGKKLRDILNDGKGTRAFLTREGDYYVPFRKRLSIARELGADLFISVHADAARNRAATGSSVYCLSLDGASSEAARILARAENLADAIGGAIGEGGNGDSDPIILDMFQTNTINLSRSVGAGILSGLCGVTDVKFPTVQSAPFLVLKLPEIPAVLVETGYISNEREERDLKKDQFQRKIAYAIAGSVRKYFSLPAVAPPAETQIPHTYKVQKGDTLGKIARRFDIELPVLLKLNNMKLHDNLHARRVITLTAGGRERLDGKEVESGKEPDKAPPPRKPRKVVHKVEKGDTLFKIAGKYDTQVGVLLKLNNMKLHDNLPVGRTIVIEPAGG